MAEFGVKRRGDKWTARPYVPGVGHVWGGTFDTQEEALKAALAKLDERRQLLAVETVESFATRWVRDYPRPKPSTNDCYARIARNFAREFGRRKLHQVDRREARAYALAHRGDTFALQAMFSDAILEGLALSNPFAKLRIPRGRGRRDIVAIAAEELDMLAELALSEHGLEFGSVFRSLVVFAAYTGLRPGELCGLDWSDVDFEAEAVGVERQLYRGTVQTPKSGEQRQISLLPTAAVALRAMTPRAPRPRCLVTGGEIVFPSKSGKRLTVGTIGIAWRPVRQAFEEQLAPPRRERLTESGGLDFYALRHFCATMLVEAGVPDWVAARQLGHQDGGRLVRLVYGHPREEVALAQLRAVFEKDDEPAPAPPIVEPSAPPRRAALRLA
jgi:integrase